MPSGQLQKPQLILTAVASVTRGPETPRCCPDKPSGWLLSCRIAVTAGSGFFNYILFYSLRSLLLSAGLSPDPGSGEPSVQLFSCILCYSLFNSIHTSHPPQRSPSGAPDLAHPMMWLLSDTGCWGSPLQLFILFYSILCILFYFTLFSVFYSIHDQPVLLCSSFRRRRGRCPCCSSLIAF